MRHRQTRQCGWHGHHYGQATVGVNVGWPCGHTPGTATPTCTAHLDHLLSQGGHAITAVPCPVCGTIGAAKVIATHDLDEHTQLCHSHETPHNMRPERREDQQ